MRKFVLPILLISVQSFSQDIAELDKRNGFKDIKLGSPIDSVSGTKLQKEFKEKDEFPAKLYSVENPEYEKIGEVKVNKVELKTYNDLIYEIKVVANKDSRLMKALESLYGKADYDIKNDTYFWKTENLILKFQSEGKNRLVLLYISYGLHRAMKDDKNKKVEDIANDF
jgi:hypothetical protein